MEVLNYSRDEIIEESIKELKKYSSGITVRQLYYRLVAGGTPNNIRYYKRVVGAMTKARWNNLIPFDAFIDRERSVSGETKCEVLEVVEEVERAKDAIDVWLNTYFLNRWSNQPYYVEVWIEKKALQGVFEGPCNRKGVALSPCKGYPSLTFLSEASDRFDAATYVGQKPVIIYYGDYDPSGTNIPESIKKNLSEMGTDVEIHRAALNPDQIEEMNLPGVPPKTTDSRSANWEGDVAVECDAIEPNKLSEMCLCDIESYFDNDKYDELLRREKEEREEYVSLLKDYLKTVSEV